MAQNYLSRLLINLHQISRKLTESVRSPLACRSQICYLLGSRSSLALSRATPCICSSLRRNFSSGNMSDIEDNDAHRRRSGEYEEIKFITKEGDPRKNPFNPALLPEQVRYDDPLRGLNPEEVKISKEIVSKVNSQIASKSHGRLFAVVYIAGRQFRVTDEDIIMLLGTYHLAVGEKIRIEKVLAVGSKEFTLLGRPVLDRGFVNVDATVINKSLSYPIIKMIHFHRVPRRIRRFDRLAETFIRINRVTLNRQLNELPISDNTVYDIR